MKTYWDRFLEGARSVGAFLGALVVAFFVLGALTYILTGKPFTFSVSIGEGMVLTATTPNLK